MGLLDEYLKRNDLNRSQLWKLTGIRDTTWASANQRDLERFTVKHIIALAEALNKTPANVLDELIQLEQEINNDGL